MSQPTLTIVAVEPQEDGRLVYMPCVPMKSGELAAHMLAFFLDMRNDGPVEVRLTNISAVLIRPVPHPPVVFSFDREPSTSALSAGTQKRFYLGTSESIPFSVPLPGTVQIAVRAEGFDDPVTITRPLEAHRTPVQAGSYTFFAKAEDLEADEYWLPGYPHPGGSQHFAHDFGVVGWNGTEFRSTKPGTSGTRNEDRRCFGKPVYAMAEGVVVRANDDLLDNPRPGWRAFRRNAEATGEAGQEIAITALSTHRQVTAIRRPSGVLRLTVWERTADGRQVQPRGAVSGGQIGSLVAVARMSSQRFATAVRTVGGSMDVRVWDLSDDAAAIFPRGKADAGTISALAVVGLSKNRFVTAVRTAEGTLKVISWGVSDDGASVTREADGQAGVISALAACALSSGRIATAVRESTGRLKIILWDIAEDGKPERGASVTGDEITLVAITALSGTRLATAVRTAGGSLKVTIWDIGTDGEITKTAENEGGEVSLVAIAPINSRVAATLVRTAQETLKAILWANKEDTPNQLDRFGEAFGGATDRIAACAVGDDFVTAGVRTVTGDLKVIVWEMLRGGGNVVWVLHGQELVLYGHLKMGSIDPSLQAGTPVQAGQKLAHVGNSGQSGGPHIHIHALRVPDGVTFEDLVEAGENGTLAEIGPYRPMPLHGIKAVAFSQLDKDSPQEFSTADGDGLYWDRMAVWPSLSTPGSG